MKIQKKNSGGGGHVGGLGWWGGVMVDVNAMLGVIWDMGDVNQEKKVLYNVQKGIVQY